MLKDSLYYITSVSGPEKMVSRDPGITEYQAAVKLNSDHPVFQGHFPGNPVLPGVCQIRIFTEVLHEILHQPLDLKEADQVKFLSMINPNEFQELTLHMQCKPAENQGIKVTATLSSGEKIFLKFKALYNLSLL